MPLPKIVTATVRTTATGVLGVAAVEGARRYVSRGTLRSSAVAATALALRGRRRAEAGAESLRLTGADIAAEARERVGETATPPGQDIVGHTHEH